MDKVRAVIRSKGIEVRGDGWWVAKRETAGSWTHTFSFNRGRLAFEIANEHLDG